MHGPVRDPLSGAHSSAETGNKPRSAVSSPFRQQCRLLLFSPSALALPSARAMHAAPLPPLPSSGQLEPGCQPPRFFFSWTRVVKTGRARPAPRIAESARPCGPTLARLATLRPHQAPRPALHSRRDESRPTSLLFDHRSTAPTRTLAPRALKPLGRLSGPPSHRRRKVPTRPLSPPSRSSCFPAPRRDTLGRDHGARRLPLRCSRTTPPT